jgi:hypothetical protein
VNTMCVVCNERQAWSFFHGLGACSRCILTVGPYHGEDEQRFTNETYRWLSAHVEAAREPAQQGALL